MFLTAGRRAALVFRQAGDLYTPATLAPRDNHRRLVSRGGHAWYSVGFGATGSVSLVAQDCTHAHASDNAALTTDSTLAAADCSHGHTAQNVVLTLDALVDLAISDAAHAHSSENLALSLGLVTLVIDDAYHAQDSQNCGDDDLDGGYMPERRRYVAVKRGKKYLLFDDQEQADEFLLAEAAAQENATKPRKVRRKGPKPPAAKVSIDTEEVAPLLRKYAPNVDLDRMIRAHEFEQVLQAKARALMAQDDDEAEFLLMVA